MSDIGDRTPGDAGDTTPASPLNGLPSPTAVTPNRKPKNVPYPDLPDFDHDFRTGKRVKRDKDTWWGTILDAEQPIDTGNNDNIYYAVLLQSGEEVLAYYPGQTVADKWDDFQRVQVSKDIDDYVIVTPPRSKSLYLWWEAIETLRPGLSAKGKILSYNTSTEEFHDFGGTVSITDREWRNLVFNGERIQVRIINEQEYEPIGSFGINSRKGKTKDDIQPNGSGLITLYKNGVKAKQPDDDGDLTEDVEITAHLNWAHGNKLFKEEKEVFVSFFTDEKKWVIVGGEC